MLEATLKYLFESTSYGVFISIIIIAVTGTWKFSKYHQNHESVKDKVGNLPCDKHSEKINKIDVINSKLDKLPCDRHSDKINQIDSIIAKLDGILQTIQLLLPKGEGGNALIQKQSPISLTEKGKELAEELNMGKHINENWDTISSYIKENSESLNPYDIQELCLNYAISYPVNVLTDTGYDRLKIKAYGEGMPAFNLLQVASILIRDRYFEEHNINLDDIDSHTPIPT